MTKHNIKFLSSVLAMSVFGITSAGAAPSVRMLGTNSAPVGTNVTVVKSDGNANISTQQRLGSIRSKAVNAGSAASVNKIAPSAVATDSDSDARLSLGKYIHSTGVSAGSIKPATNNAGSSAEISSGDFVTLSDKVENLKNTKQDVITVGDGLAMNENNELSLDSSAIQAQVEESVNTAIASVSSDVATLMGDESVEGSIANQIKTAVDAVDTGTGVADNSQAINTINSKQIKYMNTWGSSEKQTVTIGNLP